MTEQAQYEVGCWTVRLTSKSGDVRRVVDAEIRWTPSQRGYVVGNAKVVYPADYWLATIEGL